MYLAGHASQVLICFLTFPGYKGAMQNGGCKISPTRSSSPTRTPWPAVQDNTCVSQIASHQKFCTSAATEHASLRCKTLNANWLSSLRVLLGKARKCQRPQVRGAKKGECSTLARNEKQYIILTLIYLLHTEKQLCAVNKQLQFKTWAFNTISLSFKRLYTYTVIDYNSL